MRACGPAPALYGEASRGEMRYCVRDNSLVRVWWRGVRPRPPIGLKK